MITRVRNYSKKEPSKDAHKIYVICEGSETEHNYFEFFKGLSSNLQIIDIPSEDGKTDPLKLKEWTETHLLNESPDYRINYLEGDTIWYVIDTDSWEKEGKITPLRAFCEKLNDEELKKYDEVKSYPAWQVAQSNPCFEIWLYYHFYTSKPNDEDVEKSDNFKQFVSNRIQGGFDNHRDPARLGDAITNAFANFSKDEEGKLQIYSTEVYILGQEIMKFIKKDLDKLRNKLN